MGNMHAMELAGSESLSLEESIRIHLVSNHYPPVPVAMVGPCIEAIQAINEGDGNKLINLNGAAQWRGDDSAPAWAIAEGHHLDAWLDWED